MGKPSSPRKGLLFTSDCLQNLRLNELEQIVLKAGSNRERAQALSQAMSHLRTLCSQNESLWFIDNVLIKMEKNSEIFLTLTSADSSHARLASSTATFVDGDKVLLVAPVSTPANPTEWGISNIASLSVAAAFYNFSRWMRKSHENESIIPGSAGPLYKKFRGAYQGEWPVLLSGDRADLALVLGAMMQAVTTVNLLGLVRANNIDANKNHQWQSFYQNVAWSPNRLEIVEKLGITRANFYQRSAQILDEMRTSIYARPSNN